MLKTEMKFIKNAITDRLLWNDFKPLKKKPYSKKILIGYCPSRDRDNGCIAIVAPLTKKHAKYRVLEIEKIKDSSPQGHVRLIKGFTKKYNAKHIGVDVTAMGTLIFDSVLSSSYTTAKLDDYDKRIPQFIMQAKFLLMNELIEWDYSYSYLNHLFVGLVNLYSSPYSVASRKGPDYIFKKYRPVLAILNAISFLN